MNTFSKSVGKILQVYFASCSVGVLPRRGNPKNIYFGFLPEYSSVFHEHFFSQRGDIELSCYGLRFSGVSITVKNSTFLSKSFSIDAAFSLLGAFHESVAMFEEFVDRRVL